MNDLILDDYYDLTTENGDLVTDVSDEQHQKLLLAVNKGDFKENPTIGVGVAMWLNDDNQDGLLGEIKKEFEKDGMTVKSLSINEEGKLDIDARY